MRLLPALPLTLLLAWPATGRAGAPPCGSVTFEGECNGAVLSYCDPDDEVLIVVDCAEELDERATCIEVDKDYGADCAMAVGQACLFDFGGELVQMFCQGARAGCLETDTDAICVENVGPCTEDDIYTCSGNRLVWDCSVNQPHLIDCAAFGGTCGDTVCENIPEGSFCEEDVLICAAGLECGPQGLCVPGAGTDAGVRPDAAQPGDSGVAPADAGVVADGGSTADAGPRAPSEPRDESGCGCRSSSGGGFAGALGLLALVGLLGTRRKRDRA